MFSTIFYTSNLEFTDSESTLYPEIGFYDNSYFRLNTQYQLVPTLDYTKSASISLKQARLNQATQVVMRKRFARRIYN